MIQNSELRRFYLKSFEEVLGLSLNFESDLSISIINLPEVINKINPSSINNLIFPIENIIGKKNTFEGLLTDRHLMKNVLITKYIYSLINSQAEIHTLNNFVESIQIFSNRTYEQHPCQMGFIIFNNPKDNIKVELSKLNIHLIQFDKPLRIDKIGNNKEALRLIDSLSLCYVVDHKYEVIGLAKKQKSGQSISSIMSNRYHKDDETQLKYYMYRYFAKYNHNINLNVEEVDKLDTLIANLKAEVNMLTNKINEKVKQCKELEQISASTLEVEFSLNLIEDLNKKKFELLQKISSLQETQIKMLEDEYEELKNIHKRLNNIMGENKEKANKDIQFIRINSNRIEWFINDSLLCVLSNGKWRVQNYELIYHIILEFILRQYIQYYNVSSEKFLKIVGKIIPRSKILFNNIKELSNKNIGALIFFLKQTSKQKKTIYKQLLNKGRSSDSIYKKIIQTDNSKQINLYSCDTYLFELICSIDGAVLLDKNFDILSFGEMINNTISTPPVAESGSRTLAAAKASRFGLSIKISEDGDISIFEDGSPIIQL